MRETRPVDDARLEEIEKAALADLAGRRPCLSDALPVTIAGVALDLCAALRMERARKGWVSDSPRGPFLEMNEFGDRIVRALMVEHDLSACLDTRAAFSIAVGVVRRVVKETFDVLPPQSQPG